MLEKNPWPQTCEGVFTSSLVRNSNKKAESLASDSIRISSQCFKSSNTDTTSADFCAGDHIIGDYPGDDISQADNDLGFLYDECYKWADIESLEDLGGMFRSCDSPFGLGNIGDEDSVSWFSPSHAMEVSEDALKSAFGFPSPEASPFKQDEPFKVNNPSSPVSANNVDGAPSSYKSSFQASDGNKCDSFGHLTSVNESQVISESEEELIPKRQNHNPHLRSGYGYPSDQIPVSSASFGFKSRSNGLTSLSQKKSSGTSNRVPSLESSHSHSFEAPAMTGDDRREKLQCRQGLYPSYSSNPRNVNLMVQTASCNTISVPKHISHSQNDVENHIGSRGVGIRTLAVVDASNVQENFSAGTGLDEISLEASGYHQLQQVMEQLDTRTKLCIRDSLYRLARSAEQRHHHSLDGGSIDDREIGGTLMAGGTNKCNGFMDVERNTNPIDRSIAQLLFHRPSDSPLMPAHDSLPLKSNNTIHGSITSPPLMDGKLVCKGETANEADRKLEFTDDN